MEVNEQGINPRDHLALADLCVSVIEEGKGDDILKLDVSSLSIVADCFVLCTANSNPHLKALSERLRREVSRKFKVKPRTDGVADSEWIVLDYGNVVVHILTPEMRERYQLEKLWGDNSEIRRFIERLDEKDNLEP